MQATIQDESLMPATNIMAMCTCNVSCMLFWLMCHGNTNQLLYMMTNHDKSWPGAYGSAAARSLVYKVRGNPQIHRAYNIMVSCSISVTTAGRLASAAGAYVTVLECAQYIHSCCNCWPQPLLLSCIICAMMHDNIASAHTPSRGACNA